MPHKVLAFGKEGQLINKVAAQDMPSIQDRAAVLGLDVIGILRGSADRRGLIVCQILGPRVGKVGLRGSRKATRCEDLQGMVIRIKPRREYIQRAVTAERPDLIEQRTGRREDGAGRLTRHGAASTWVLQRVRPSGALLVERAPGGQVVHSGETD